MTNDEREKLLTFCDVLIEWLEDQIRECDDNDLPSTDYWFSRARTLNEVIDFVNEYSGKRANP